MMRPSLLWEKIANDSELNAIGIITRRVIESQSIDKRPFSDGYFITINMEESTIRNTKLGKGPRTVTIAVHREANSDRSYSTIDSILNRIDRLLLPIDDEKGVDGVRVSQVSRGGRSGNLIDEGWNTITRTATYGVLYNEYDD